MRSLKKKEEAKEPVKKEEPLIKTIHTKKIEVKESDQTSEEVKETVKKEEAEKLKDYSETVKSPKEDLTATLTDEGEKDSQNVHVSEIKVIESNSIISQSVGPVIVGVIVGIITAVAIILVYPLVEKKPFVQKTVAPTPVVSIPSPSPTEATDSANLVKDMALYDIKIFNGSGKGGEAGKLQDFLKSKGFSILDIGNADKSDYKMTLVKTKKNVPQTFLDKLNGYLSDLFTLDKIGSLAESAETDIEIIVGSLPKETANPSATVVPQ